MRERASHHSERYYVPYQVLRSSTYLTDHAKNGRGPTRAAHAQQREAKGDTVGILHVMVNKQFKQKHDEEIDDYMYM